MKHLFVFRQKIVLTMVLLLQLLYAQSQETPVPPPLEHPASRLSNNSEIVNSNQAVDMISKFILPVSALPSVIFTRDYNINQYSTMLISSPVSGQQIGQTNTAYQQHYKFTDTGWVQIFDDTEEMTPGVGYSKMAYGNGQYTNAFPISPYKLTYNGSENEATEYQVPLYSGYSFLGNPYSQYLDLDAFLLDSENQNVIAPISIWTQNTRISTVNGTQIYNNTPYDYAVYSLMGGVSAGRNVTLLAGAIMNENLNPYYEIPNGILKFGTGFFVRSNAGTAKFKKSSMTITDNGIYDQFFTTIPNNTTPTTAPVAPTSSIAKHRIWINMFQGDSAALTSTTSSYRQTLVGYANHTGATAGDNDAKFDAELAVYPSNPTVLSVYSLATTTSTKKLTIQGKNISNFSVNDFIPLGYKINAAGTYTFSAFGDGMFGTSQPYYIKDMSNGITYSFPYTVNLTALEDNTRFRIVFKATYTLNLNAQCGATNININTLINSTPIPNTWPAVDSLLWEFKNLSTGQLGTFITSSPNLTSCTMSNVVNFSPTPPNYFFTYNTNYEVRIKVKFVGQSDFLPYFGKVCQIRTVQNEIKAANTNCGGVLQNATQISCSPGSIGLNYRWKITRSDGQIRIFDSQPTTPPSFLNAFTFYSIVNNPTTNPIGALSGGFIIPNTTYDIQMALIYDPANPIPSIIGEFCAPCSFTTGANSFRLNDINFEITAYPNPFKNDFILDIQSSSHDDIYVQVFDLLGKTIEFRTIKASEINDKVSFGDNYSKGVYTLIVNQGEDKKVIKMVKQ